MSLRPYPEYKDSGVDWLGDIPTHWEVYPHRSIFTEIIERGYPDEEMLSVTILQGIIRQAQLLSNSSKKDSSNTDKSKYKLVSKGDIAYNKMRAWQGAIGASDYRGIISPAYIIVRLRENQNYTKYFHYLFRTPLFTTEAERWSYGITSDQWSLRYSEFKQIYSPLPPPDEQAAIVRFLDVAEKRIRRYIRAKQKLIKLLNEQKQAIIQQAVTRGLNPDVPMKDSGVEWLGEIPSHWEVRRLKWVTRLQRGYDLPQDKRRLGDYPVISSGGFIDTHDEFRARGPGVVMGRYGSTENIFFVETDYWPHNTALFVTDFQDNDPMWCFYLLRTISKADHAGKSAVPGVDRKDLYEIFVSLPPYGEQVAIVEHLEKKLLDLNFSLEKVIEQIDLIREYRTRLIADVVTGKVDVRGLAFEMSEAFDDDDLLDVDEDELLEDDESEEMFDDED